MRGLPTSSASRRSQGTGPQGSRRIVVDCTVYRWWLPGRRTARTWPGRPARSRSSNWFGCEGEPVLLSAVAAAARLPCTRVGLRWLRPPHSTLTSPPASRPRTEQSREGALARQPTKARHDDGCVDWSRTRVPRCTPAGLSHATELCR